MKEVKKKQEEKRVAQKCFVSNRLDASMPSVTILGKFSLFEQKLYLGNFFVAVNLIFGRYFGKILFTDRNLLIVNLPFVKITDLAKQLFNLFGHTARAPQILFLQKNTKR